MQQARRTFVARHRAQAAGFSTIELLIVAALIIVLAAMAIFMLSPQRRAYRSEDAAAQAANFLRDAYQRALSQRQTFAVRIDRANRLIQIVDENRLPVGDEREVRRDVLSDEVNFDPPVFGGTVLAPPAAPYNYPTATYVSNVWTARFRSDGSVVDANGNLISATLFFSPTNSQNIDKRLVRAVTLFGPSGSVRVWKYDGTNFDAGGR
jgi:type II secretory pathway pseudopilin PulG